MSRRVGIEISATRCAIVEVELPRARSPQVPTRVRRFKTIPWGPDTAATLAGTLRQMRASRMVSKHAVVALWGVRSAHQVMSLPPAKPADLHALALREAKKTVPLLASEGESSSGLLLDSVATLPGAKREVTLVVASAADVRARLAPIVAAGFTVDAVVTVPVALASLARRLNPHASGAQAYVAVNGDATAVAIVRHGLLVFAREIPLTFSPAAINWQAAQKTEFADRLAAELKRSFLFYKQQSKLDVEQVFVCGEFPDLRTLTAPLIHALDIEVETLDSMEGLGWVAPDSSAIDIRDRAGELRVPWALAAETRLPINLLPQDVAGRRAVVQLASRTAAAVGVAAMLLIGMYTATSLFGKAIEGRAAELRQEISLLEPKIQAIKRAGAERTRNVARKAALTALSAHGPRLARVLEVLGASTPLGIVLDSVGFTTHESVWRVTARGRASGVTPADAQAAFNQFLKMVANSPLVGEPAEPPSMSVSSRDRVLAAAARDKAGATSSTGQTPGQQARQWVVENRGDGLDPDQLLRQRLLAAEAAQVDYDNWLLLERERYARLYPQGDPRIRNTMGWVVEGVADPDAYYLNRGANRELARRPLYAQPAPRIAPAPQPAPRPVVAPPPAALLEFTVVYEVRR